MLGPGVQEFMRRAGVLHQAAEMLECAAVVTHRDGNRRWQSWILQIDDGVITKITDSRNGDSSHPKEGEFVVWDECLFCDDGTCGRANCVEGRVRTVRRLR